MMKKILFLCMIVLASTNLLAQDFEATFKKIKSLQDSIESVKLQKKVKDNESKYNPNNIDTTLSKVSDFVENLEKAESKLVKIQHLNNINTFLDNYKKAIYGNGKISVTSDNYITAIIDLRDYVGVINNTQIIDTIVSGPNSVDSIFIVISENGKKKTIATIHKMDNSSLCIKNDNLIINKNEIYGFMIANLITLIFVIIIVILLVRIKNSQKEQISSNMGKNEQNKTTHIAGKGKKGCSTSKDVNKEHTNPTTEERLEIGEMLQVYKSIEKLINNINNNINEMSANISSLKESIDKHIEEDRQKFATEEEKYKNSSPNNETSKQSRPQKVKLYGNLSQDGSMIYKASDTLREEYFYQINLNSANDLEGELVIREGLSTEKMMNAISDRTKYLASPACTITSDKDPATRIEMVEKGTVRRQGYDWEIVSPVKVKIV